jgi:hypothetical protein
VHLGCAQALGHLRSLTVREHPVEHDGVEDLFPRTFVRVLRIRGDHGGVSLVSEDTGQELGELGVVFYD